uniref:Uncharacterized protein n=1 Tax=viral metagenome TaxID=1070528 RepID=A0A6C0HHA4_9ZZZZ
MDNYRNIDEDSSQIFFKYEQERNAIYVSPAISNNYGFILPISISRPLSGNTSTFIYERKRGCEMFIAPVSRCQDFSKAFVSYNKYNQKLNNHIRQIRSEQNLVSWGHASKLKKTYSLPDLGVINKLTQIFGNGSNGSNKNKVESRFEQYAISSTPKWPIPTSDFKPPEPLDIYFVGGPTTNEITFVEDFIFDD